MSKILFAEDDQRMSSVMGEHFEKAGFDVTIVDNGKDADKLAHNGIYDVIVLDLMLPEMTGVEIIKSLKNDKINTPILCLTALSNLENKAEAFDAGADDYLTKPFQVDECIMRVNALIRRSAMSNENENKMIQFEDLVLDVNQDTLICGNKKMLLQGIESKYLETLISNTDKYLKIDEIRDRVWGDKESDKQIDVETAWGYISAIRKRIKEIGSSVELVSKRRVGYRLELPEKETK